MLYCLRQLCTMVCIQLWAVVIFYMWLGLAYIFYACVCCYCKGSVCIFVCFRVCLDHVAFVLFKLVLLGLLYSVRSQEIGWEDCLRNDLFCVKLDVRPCSISILILSLFTDLVMEGMFMSEPMSVSIFITKDKLCPYFWFMFHWIVDAVA